MMKITFVACVVVGISSCICDDFNWIGWESGKCKPLHVHIRNAADPILRAVAALSRISVDNRYFDTQLLPDLSWNSTERPVGVTWVNVW
jgi:hypothetical protein